MRVHIWERVYNLTNNYHSDGGLVIIAENLEAANVKWAEHVKSTMEVYDPEYENRVKVLEAADRVYEIVGDSVESEVKPEVFVFPDAGCC